MALLHLDSSAHRDADSISRRLTARFAHEWRSRHAAAVYRYRDLAATPVVPIGRAYCALGRRVESRAPLPVPVEALIGDDDERREWSLTRELVDELVACDVLLVGAPMYNYAAPAALKTWIDRVGFPGVFTGDDGAALLDDLQVVVVTSRGGAYGPGTRAGERDFLTPHLQAWLTRQGVRPDRIEFVSTDMTLATIVPGREHQRPAAAAALAAAEERVTAAAQR